MSTSFGWENKGRYGSFCKQMNVGCAGKTVRSLENACHTQVSYRCVHDKALYKSTFTLPYLTKNACKPKSAFSAKKIKLTARLLQRVISENAAQAPYYKYINLHGKGITQDHCQSSDETMRPKLDAFLSVTKCTAN